MQIEKRNLQMNSRTTLKPQKELISPSELIRQQQEILARNGENQRKRDRLNEITINKHRVFDDIGRLDEQIATLQKQKEQLTEEYNQAVRDEETARKTVLELQDESTAELEASLANIEEINRKVRANMDKDKAEDDALDYKNQYNALTAEIDKTRREKTDLLQSAKLPLPELSVKDGELIYKGQQWDNMSGSDRPESIHGYCSEIESEMRFCPHGQAGADGHEHAAGIRTVVRAGRTAGDCNPSQHRRRMQHHHRRWVCKR